MYHTVQQGEHLSSIAAKYGFADYLTIWNHANNANLKKRRLTPNVLYPEDRVFIPDRQQEWKSCNTDRRHRFLLRTPVLKLKLVVEDQFEKPVANARCLLLVEGESRQVTTDADGQIEQRIPKDAQFAALTERNDANAPNRRVMVLLFRPGSRVIPNKWPCPRADEGTLGCRKRFWSDGEKRRGLHLPDEDRKFEKTKDTFACGFYQRLSDGSPCERILPFTKIRLFDSRGNLLPRAPFVVISGSIQSERSTADENGEITLLDIGTPVVTVRWSRPRDKRKEERPAGLPPNTLSANARIILAGHSGGGLTLQSCAKSGQLLDVFPSDLVQLDCNYGHDGGGEAYCVARNRLAPKNLGLGNGRNQSRLIITTTGGSNDGRIGTKGSCDALVGRLKSILGLTLTKVDYDSRTKRPISPPDVSKVAGSILEINHLSSTYTPMSITTTIRLFLSPWC